MSAINSDAPDDLDDLHTTRETDGTSAFPPTEEHCHKMDIATSSKPKNADDEKVVCEPLNCEAPHLSDEADRDDPAGDTIRDSPTGHWATDEYYGETGETIDADELITNASP